MIDFTPFLHKQYLQFVKLGKTWSTMSQVFLHSKSILYIDICYSIIRLKASSYLMPLTVITMYELVFITNI